MLPKKKRVNKETFNKVLKEGFLLNTPFFLFRFLIQKEPQFSVVVPNKVSKKATTRNKFKRIVYNYLRQTKDLSGLGVFFYKKEGILLSKKEIEENIKYLLKKSKLIK